MGFDLKITGGNDLLSVRRALKDVGDKGLGRRMGKGLRDAAKPLGRDVEAEASIVMPSRGGYRGVLVPALRLRQRTSETRWSADVIIRVYADGRGDRRDVRRLNLGQLRHPDRVRRGVRGLRSYRREWTRTRPRRRIPGGQLIPNSWSVTSIRPGFVDRPFERLKPQVVEAMQGVIDDVARQIGAS